MADQQGTGKHPHKSAAEPHEHHEAPTTKGASHTTEAHTTKSATGTHKESSSESHSDGQGTGKHPHKKASDPHEHHEGAKK